jgi:hypothetical protein
LRLEPLILPPVLFAVPIPNNNPADKIAKKFAIFYFFLGYQVKIIKQITLFKYAKRPDF